MEGKGILDLLYELNKKCIQNDEDFFNSLNISLAEYNMFICLKDCKHFNNYSVAEKMNLSLSRVSRIIDKMVYKEFLSRTISKTDRRAIDIKMTPKGKETLKRIMDYRAIRAQKIDTEISENEKEKIAVNLNKLISIIQ
jgi:DNA-binding MarR family transcriptional regulator